MNRSLFSIEVKSDSILSILEDAIRKSVMSDDIDIGEIAEQSVDRAARDAVRDAVASVNIRSAVESAAEAALDGFDVKAHIKSLVDQAVQKPKQEENSDE